MDLDNMTKVNDAYEVDEGDGIRIDFSQGIYSGTMFIEYGDCEYSDEGYNIDDLDVNNNILVADFIDHYGIDLSKLPSLEDASAPTVCIYDYVTYGGFDANCVGTCFYLDNDKEDIEDFVERVRNYKFAENASDEERNTYGLHEIMEDFNKDFKSFDIGDALFVEDLNHINKYEKGDRIIMSLSSFPFKFSTYNIEELKRKMEELGFDYDTEKNINFKQFYYFTDAKGNSISFDSCKAIANAIKQMSAEKNHDVVGKAEPQSEHNVVKDDFAR